MDDLIKRADAIEAVCRTRCGDKAKGCPAHSCLVIEEFDALLSADTIPIEKYHDLQHQLVMLSALLADKTESPNDVIESQNDVIKKPRMVRYKLHKPIEYVSIEFDEEEEITHIDHYTAYGERSEPNK